MMLQSSLATATHLCKCLSNVYNIRSWDPLMDQSAKLRSSFSPLSSQGSEACPSLPCSSHKAKSKSKILTEEGSFSHWGGLTDLSAPSQSQEPSSGTYPLLQCFAVNSLFVCFFFSFVNSFTTYTTKLPNAVSHRKKYREHYGDIKGTRKEKSAPHPNLAEVSQELRILR